MANKTVNIADKTTLDAINTKAGEIKTAVDTVNTNTAGVGTKVDEVKTAVQTINENTSGVGTKVDGVKTVVDASKTAIDATKATSEQILNVLQQQQRSDIIRYGIRIRKSESQPANRVEYIHDAVGMTAAQMDFAEGRFNYGSWENVWFVKNNYPCMLNPDGSVAYKLNPNDYTKKIDGSDSDVANTESNLNAMSAIPLCYVSMYEDGDFEYIIVANDKYDDSYHAVAHTKEDGSIVPQIFLSIFKGSNVGSKLRSLSGQWMEMNKNAQQEIDLAKANGTGWYTRTWGQRTLINALLLIMGKSDNTQAVFGTGVTNTYVNDANQHYGMIQPGSEMNQKGQFYGTNDNVHQVKVFHMEDWWGNQWERIAGLINANGTIKVSMTGPYNLTGAGYDTVPCDAPYGTNGGYAKKAHVSRFGRIPNDASGSESTYLCDGLWFNNGQVDYAFVGGACRHGAACGASYLDLGTTSGYTAWSVGACLSFV